VWAEKGSMDWVLCNWSKTERLWHARVIWPVKGYSFEKYHIVRSVP